MAMHVQSAPTENVMASKPDFVMANKRTMAIADAVRLPTGPY
jgi:hypothetical protein